MLTPLPPPALPDASGLSCYPGEALLWQDDYLSVSGSMGSQELPEFVDWLCDQLPLLGHPEAAKGNGKYQTGIRFPQSSAMLRTARVDELRRVVEQDFNLEIPGGYARGALAKLREHPNSGSFQCSRRDIACTRVLEDPAAMYAEFAVMVSEHKQQPAFRHGPAHNSWEGTSYATHAKPNVERYAILYDKHAQNPADFPTPNTIRLEFRLSPDRKENKRQLLLDEPEQALGRWRFARSMALVFTGREIEKYKGWTQREAVNSKLLLQLQGIRGQYWRALDQAIKQHGLEVVTEILSGKSMAADYLVEVQSAD